MVAEEIVVVDKDVDGQLIRILAESENGASYVNHSEIMRHEVISKQQLELGDLVDEMPERTVLRRFLKIFFPLVEENQRVRS